MIEARRLLLPSIAEQAAARATDADIASLEALGDGLAAGFDPRLIVRFHAVLASLAANGFLAAAIEPLIDAPDAVCRTWLGPDAAGRHDAVLASHRAIIEALRAHDAPAARNAMLELLSHAPALNPQPLPSNLRRL
jgi:DNA-binding FadR family transcriptional regulator